VEEVPFSGELGMSMVCHPSLADWTQEAKSYKSELMTTATPEAQKSIMESLAGIDDTLNELRLQGGI